MSPIFSHATHARALVRAARAAMSGGSSPVSGPSSAGKRKSDSNTEPMAAGEDGRPRLRTRNRHDGEAPRYVEPSSSDDASSDGDDGEGPDDKEEGGGDTERPTVHQTRERRRKAAHNVQERRRARRLTSTITAIQDVLQVWAPVIAVIFCTCMRSRGPARGGPTTGCPNRVTVLSQTQGVLAGKDKYSVLLCALEQLQRSSGTPDGKDA